MILSGVRVLKNALVLYDSFENEERKIPQLRYALHSSHNSYNSFLYTIYHIHYA